VTISLAFPLFSPTAKASKRSTTRSPADTPSPEPAAIRWHGRLEVEVESLALAESGSPSPRSNAYRKTSSGEPTDTSAVLAFWRRARRLRWHEPECVVLMLAEDGEEPLDGVLVADQHYPAVVRELYVGRVEMPLLCGQPNFVHTSSCIATRSYWLGAGWRDPFVVVSIVPA
jgi:hypothetical protein